MSENDFLDSMQEEAELRWGKRLTPQEAAEKFALHGMDARVQHLKNMRTPESMTINQAADRHKYESAIRAMHEKLRRSGR
jgi:hypothetical protein